MLSAVPPGPDPLATKIRKLHNTGCHKCPFGLIGGGLDKKTLKKLCSIGAADRSFFGVVFVMATNRYPCFFIVLFVYVQSFFVSRSWSFFQFCVQQTVAK